MRWWDEWRRRLAALRHRDRFDRDLAEEIKRHLDMQAEELRANGLRAEEARLAAKRQFGNGAAIQERSREAWGWGWLERLWQDARFALRGLRKSPGFTAIAILTVALGIGANTAIFSVVNAVLLRPLPYREPSRLLSFSGDDQRRDFHGAPASPADFLDWKAQTAVFEQMAATGYASYVMHWRGEPRDVRGASASSNLFRLLGVHMLMGRDFREGEESPAAPPVVIISYNLWRRQFASDHSVIGKTAAFGNVSRTIIGVTAPDFHYPSEREEFWTPLNIRPGERRGALYLQTVARLKPGATLEQARAEARIVSARLAAQYPATNGGRVLSVHPLGDGVQEQMRRALWVMLCAVGLVALIGCANLAALLLARTASRRREIAVRLALGAGRTRLVRYLLAETAMLAAMGGLTGVALARWGVRGLIELIPTGIPRIHETSLDGSVLAFAFALSVLTAGVVGLAPALAASRLDLNRSLKEGAGSRAAGGVRGNRLRNALVVAQIALAMVLLAGAGLLMRSFVAQMQVNLGFDPEHVLALEAGPLPPEVLNRIGPRIEKFPRVVAVAAASSYPNTTMMATMIRVQGRPALEPPSAALCEMVIVSPGYFSTLRIRLLKGRDLSERDGPDAPHAAVVNETMTRRFFPGDDPLGKVLLLEGNNEPITVVGVADDVRGFGPMADRMPAVYFPYAQNKYTPDFLMVRTSGDPMKLAAAVRAEIRAEDKNRVISVASTLDRELSESVATPRFYAVLLGAFAALALALALIGIYGVISYAVAQATHEIGVRMALGAGRGRVMRLVMRRGAALVGGGVLFGAAGAYTATRALRTLLYRVEPSDPATFIAVTLLLIVVALAACAYPASRATRIDPMEALRYE